MKPLWISDLQGFSLFTRFGESNFGHIVCMLKAGDHVHIQGTEELGTVKEVHPHEVIVRVATENGHEDRRYALESLRLEPTMSEATGFIDH